MGQSRRPRRGSMGQSRRPRGSPQAGAADRGGLHKPEPADRGGLHKPEPPIAAGGHKPEPRIAGLSRPKARMAAPLHRPEPDLDRAGRVETENHRLRPVTGFLQQQIGVRPLGRSIDRHGCAADPSSIQQDVGLRFATNFDSSRDGHRNRRWSIGFACS